MKKILVIFISFLSMSCEAQEVPTQFSQEALDDTFITLSGDEVAFKTILDKYKGKQILIDVWASWCKDCIKGMPNVKTLQKDYPETVFVFLSLDRSQENWKKGIKTYNVKGEHYFMQSGWKGAFGDFLDLDWIPRYLVVDSQGQIKLYKAIKANDNKIIEALK